MGFYGKVEHADKLNFVIDKIYPNRKTMDASVDTDGVFIGRYVLIEYEQSGQSSYLKLFKKPDTMDFYFDTNFNADTRAKYTEDKSKEIGDYYIELNEIIYALDENNIQQFYKCTGEKDTFAVFSSLGYSPIEDGNYHSNYRIDIEKYGESRGFDSTVWQKIYVDEKESYVMIAELNSVVPTFDITVDAPTLNPIPPHFDADSNNVYYKLHMQPNWGFKIREAAKDEESDITITAKLAEWDETNKTINNKYKNYKGAIYFNRDGFGSQYHYNKNDKKVEEVNLEENKIQFSTEGSGRKYNSAHYLNQNDPKNHHDIQALEIILPGIGRALSELWDLAYGTGEYIDGDSEKKERNREIKWDTMTGLRLVKTSRNPDVSGFEYDTVGVDSIAGCINSVHDLIGMIIVSNEINAKNEDNYVATTDKYLEIDEALVNRIYYNPKDGQYYIKDLTYNYPEVSTEDVILNVKQFGDNYYYKNGNNYYKELEGYQAGNQYYEFGSDVVAPVKLCQEVWKPNTYYYEEDGNFKLDSSTLPDENKQYFKINQDLEEIEVIVTNKQTELCFFPTSYTADIYNQLFPTVKATATVPGKGLFYTGTDAYGQKGYLPYEQGKGIGYQTPLHYWNGYEIEVSTTTDGQFIETYEFGRATDTLVNVIPFVANTFYYQDEETKDWILLKSEANIDLTKKYYQFGETGIEKIPIDGLFYEPNLYYYLDYVDYIMDTDTDREPGIQYYTIDEKQISAVSEDIVFYEPGKYYYKEGDEFILDTAEQMTPDRIYYKDNYVRYIHPDSTNPAFIPGAIWNEEIKSVPADVKLANREEIYQWKQLNGFSRSLNTINGLILKINNLLKFDDTLTRDSKTVQGCINQINDMINTIEKLKPNHFIAVNENGKMTSMTQSTDDWIHIEINKDNDDIISVTHEFNPIEDSTNETDINDNGNVINLYTPKVDEKGHVVGKNIEIVTLPFSYKTFQDSESIPGKTIAQNTQDILTLEGDSWIKPVITQGKIKYTHIGPVISDESAKDNLTPSFGDTFEIEDWYFDEKGHKSNKTTHTIQIPKGSLTAAASNGSDVITQIEFIPATGAITTIRSDIANLTLNSYKKENSNEDINANDTLGSALSKLQTQIIEEEAARSAASDKSASDLANAIAKEVEDRNAAILIETNNRTNAISAEAAAREQAIGAERDARIAAINALDANILADNSEVIVSVSQTDGVVSAGKKRIGEINLTGWTLGENVSDPTAIADTDNVFTAFAKAQRQINANKIALAVLNGNSTTEGSIAYQIAQIVNNNGGSIDTLNEIAAWIISDTTGAAKMNADITVNAASIEALEVLVGNESVAIQIADAIEIALMEEGKNKYALAADLINLSTELSNITGRIQNLENAVPATKIAKWDAAANSLSNYVSLEAYNALLEKVDILETRLKALEDTINSPGEELEEPSFDGSELPVE